MNNAVKVIGDSGIAPNMKLGILTSNQIRHRYFANALRSALDVVAVGYENTGYHQAKIAGSDLSPAEAEVVANHFAERDRQEERFFGHSDVLIVSSTSCAVRTIEPGGLNAIETLEFLRSADVEAIAVFGTNLIKPPLLEAWPGRMINMHLGLSPYYRGTATNFYPLLNDEPQYIGATIHLLDAGIDSGKIVRHARPTIVADDGPHTIGCKTILAGIAALIRSLHELEAGRMRTVPQWEVANPRLYLRKDYHHRQVVELYEKLDSGLIPRYVARADDVAARVKLID